jgi:hypothetical protein
MTRFFVLTVIIVAVLALPSLTVSADSGSSFSFDLFRWYTVPAISIPTTGDIAADVATVVAIGSMLLTMAKTVIADLSGKDQAKEEMTVDDSVSTNTAVDK